MGSPVRYAQHGRPDANLSAWLSFYRLATPGVEQADNCTLRLDLDNEPQPDLLLRLPERVGGRSRVAADGHLEGAPELVVEVAASSVSYDLHEKLAVYRRSGVLEYLVHRVDDGEVDWFVLTRGAYVRTSADAGGLLRSQAFPGLWLDVGALLRGDLEALHRVVARRLADPAHAAFLARLRAS